MSWGYRNLVRPILFAQDAEEVHNRTMRGLAWAGRRGMVCEAVASFFGAPPLPVESPCPAQAASPKSTAASPAHLTIAAGGEDGAMRIDTHSSLFSTGAPFRWVPCHQFVRRTPNPAIPRTAFRLERPRLAINGMGRALWYKPDQRRRR